MGASSGSHQPSGTANTPTNDSTNSVSSSASSSAPSAAAGAAAAATPAGSPGPVRSILGALLPTPTSWTLLTEVFSMLRGNLVPILLIFAAKDGLSFLLHRASQRLTNMAAEALLGLPLSQTINPWWLYMDPAFLEANQGYVCIIALFFLLTLPVSMLLSVYATSASAMLIATSTPSPTPTSSTSASSSADSPPPPPPPSSSPQPSPSSRQSPPQISTAGPANRTTTSSSSSTGSGGSSAPTPKSTPKFPFSLFSSTLTPTTLNTTSTPTTIKNTNSSSNSNSGATGRSSSSSSSSSSTGSPSSSKSRNGFWRPSWAEEDSDSIAALGELGIIKDDRSNSRPYGSSPSTPQPSWDDGDVAAGAVSITATSSNRQQGGSRSIDDGDLVELARARAVAEFSDRGGAGGDSSGVGSSKSDASSTAAADAKPPGWFAPLRRGIAVVLGLLPAVHLIWRRAWVTELVFTLQAIPLQAASLLVIPTYWTVPRFLGIQLALPVSILEGSSGTAALDRSLQLMSSARGSYGWPLLSLLLCLRLVDTAREALLQLLPPRYWQEVMEIPFVVIAVCSCLKLALARMQDLLPLATYLHLTRSEAASPAAEQQRASEASKASVA
ncbi:MAG: hypothetical protein WDW36_007339 [Sanguina aurantia]